MCTDDLLNPWYAIFYQRDATGKFPDYPSEEEGGSAAIFKEKDPAEVEAELKAKVSKKQQPYIPS